MLETSTKVELRSKINNARTVIFLRINRKISCQSFICFERAGVLKSVFINFSYDKIQSSKIAAYSKYYWTKKPLLIDIRGLKKTLTIGTRINRKIDNMFIHIYPLTHDTC